MNYVNLAFSKNIIQLFVTFGILQITNEQHSEEDIEKALNYLRLNHPELANREEAIKLLEGMQDFAEDFVASLHKEEKNEES